MTEQTCDVVSIELETKPWKPEGKGTWVVTVDHNGETREFRISENPSKSPAEADTAEKLAEYQNADVDLVVDVRENTSPMTPDTTYSFHDLREA